MMFAYSFMINNLEDVLTAIAEGYIIEVYHDNIIVVENPKFVEGERHMPRISIDVKEVIDYIKSLEEFKKMRGGWAT